MGLDETYIPAQKADIIDCLCSDHYQYFTPPPPT